MKNTKEIDKINEVVNDLYLGGVIQRGAGFCLSMSEIVSTLLRQKGVKTRLVECKLTVMQINPPGLLMIGHDGLTANRQIDLSKEMDVHVVCVAEIETPMLIDLSVYGVDPSNPFIVQPLNPESDRENSLLLDFKSDNSNWIYQSKPGTQLPRLMQQSLIDRIKLDRKVDNSIRMFGIMILLILVVTVLNFTRGGMDFYEKYLDKDNNWGPNSQTEILDRLKRLESDIEQNSQ